MVEARVLGSLLEKERTVPDQYPLSLNAIQLSSNQSTNREPVMVVSEREIETALASLKAQGLLRYVHPTSGRGVTKYRQIFDEKLGLEPEDTAVMCVLLLRGPQTSGELRTRCERLHGFDSAKGVERVLHSLAHRDEPLVHRLERQAGQSHARWQQLFAEEDPSLLLAHPTGGAPVRVTSAVAEELATLRARVDELGTRLATLEQLLT